MRPTTKLRWVSTGIVEKEGNGYSEIDYCVDPKCLRVLRKVELVLGELIQSGAAAVVGLYNVCPGRWHQR